MTVATKQNYLAKFGYLPQSAIETGNLRSEEQLRDAIRSLQEFGNIPVTGEVDDATIELLHKKRCGVKDKLKGRFKRFVLQGQKWPNASLTWR
ncbi:matrix metalloproteinase-2-like [Ctenocephalides felis]|uniref:matrix metalloproteinase-2-like n=1 Tax=Ctenocephalides felis TaxID=7515 RepID=UPI000E6E1E55|nr:matrix metalloproteinase-2-like [Ctenocephalides felis]